MSAVPIPTERRQPTAQEFRDMQKSDDFVELRRRFRSFAFPMSFAFFTLYLVYVLTATFAPDWMATPIFGSVNIGIIFGLLQFVSTFAITWVYISYSNKRLEPLASKVRQEMEQ